MHTVSFPKLGLEFNINPTALQIGSFRITWYGVIIAVGILLAMLDQGPLGSLLAGLNFQVSGMPAIHIAMVGMIVLTVIYGAVFYIVTTVTLKKRLNLE